MQKIIVFILCCFMTFFLYACSSKFENVNPLGRSFGEFEDTDPLKLGLEPTFPTNQEIPSLISGADLVPITPITPPLTRTSNSANNNAVNGINPRFKDEAFNDVLIFENRPAVSDFLTILGPSGATLTVWALAQGNWIWGYTLIDSKGFGDARVWQLLLYPNDFAMIKNAKTNTCLNAYGNGIVHYPCDASNHAQMWKLIPMSNTAVQIKNLGNGKCIQAPITNLYGDFHKVFKIFTVECAKKDNFDQQWFLTTPPFTAKPLYRQGEVR